MNATTARTTQESLRLPVTTDTEVDALSYSLIESARLAGVGLNTHLRAATMAALRGEPVLLPHRLAYRRRG